MYRQFFTILAIITTTTFLMPGSVFAAPAPEETNKVNEVEEVSEVNGIDDVRDLRQLIEGKNTELQNLQKEREELEEKLEEVEGVSNTLTREINNINYRTSQLNVSIKRSGVMVDKFGLEIESLNNDALNTGTEIKNTKETIVKLLVRLQQKDHENLLVILLKSESLADGMSEIQSIITLSSNLSSNITQLQGLKNKLSRKAKEAQNKKQQQEIEQKTLENRQYIIGNQKKERQYLLAQTKNQEKIYEEKIAELDEKQKEISDVMTAIEEQLRAAFDPSLLPAERPGVLAFPVQDPYITQHYGRTKFAQRAYRTKFHSGIDFRAPLGTPILAVEDGVIAAVDNNDKGLARWLKYQYGTYILIEHNNNLSSIYAHLSRAIVEEGSEVKRGDIIGYSGNTGYSTGSHLHFGVYATPVLGWREIRSKEGAGLISIPPAAGLVPVGVNINPEGYLPNI